MSKKPRIEKFPYTKYCPNECDTWFSLTHDYCPHCGTKLKVRKIE